jgi:hypothetical protein
MSIAEAETGNRPRYQWKADMRLVFANSHQSVTSDFASAAVSEQVLANNN